MNSQQRLSAFVTLGTRLSQITPQQQDELIIKAKNENPWFTSESVTAALNGLSFFLSSGEQLQKWFENYPPITNPRKIALVMAGNIPLVGFHDLLCILISGHSALVKLSSRDQFLPRFIVEELIEIENNFASKIIFTDRLKDFDAVIATGSDNSARYFEYYFSKYPHIIRKNRTSQAILTGNESDKELEDLGIDVFTYYGLGCRNVSRLLVPAGYTFDRMLSLWEKFQPVIHHHKYINNYDYQKSILLINRIPFLDNGFVLLQQSTRPVSPISVLYYDYYESEENLTSKVAEHAEKIQITVGNHPLANIRFGGAQCPGLTDYPDNVDIMKFLSELN
jgi:hypothetical protein